MKKAFYMIISLLMPTRNLRHRVQKAGHRANKFDIIKNLLDVSQDIQKTHPARGYTHEMQAFNLNIVRAFDKLCRENGIEYFAIGGLILGKLRHNGFIPWDDDVDVGLMHREFMRLVDILAKHIPNADFHILYTGNLIKIIHTKTGAFLDVFQYENYTRDVDYIADMGEVTSRKRKYVNSIKYRMKKTIKITNSMDAAARASAWRDISDIISDQRKLFNRIVCKNKKQDPHGAILSFSRFSPVNEFYTHSTILPTKRSDFCGISLSFPNNIEIYALKCWGDIYKYPNDIFDNRHKMQIVNINNFMEWRRMNALKPGDFYKTFTGKK